MHNLPGQARTEFFGVAAQVIPVAFLGLAIEAKVFGRAKLRGTKFAIAAESLRTIGDISTLGVLIAGQAVALTYFAEGSEHETFHAGFVYFAIAWGFTAVATLSLIGSAAPRVTPSVRRVGQGRDHGGTWLPDAHHIMVGLGNKYGDTDVTPLLNIQFPAGCEIWAATSDGLMRPADIQVDYSDDVLEKGKEIVAIKYLSNYTPVPTGQHAVGHYVIRGPSQIPVRAKFSHHSFPSGDVNAYTVLPAPNPDGVPGDYLD